MHVAPVALTGSLPQNASKALQFIRERGVKLTNIGGWEQASPVLERR